MSYLEEVLPGQCWTGFGLTLTVSKSEGMRANVRLAGDLDTASARVLTAALEHELALGRRFVRLDLSGLAFINSTGIQGLVDAHWMFLSKRGTLILLGLSPQARRLASLTQTDRVLLIAADQIETAVPVA